MNIEEANRIPGMVESVEQRLLYDLGAAIALQPGESVVEFGTFFGRSTDCLAQGLAANPRRQATNRLHAYDSFRCVRNGNFAQHVNAYAKRGGVERLIGVSDAGLDFRKVFEHYLETYVKSGLLAPVQAELRDSQPPDGDIALMHVDSPKFYEELKIVAFRFFPRLREGSTVVFQDFFFHWSATLIAAVVAMKNRGLVRFKGSAASSLVTEVLRRPAVDDAAEVDLAMTQKSQVRALLEQAPRECAGIPLDRPEVFLPRLHLARFQYLWQVESYPEAAKVIVDFFNSGGKLNPHVINDYMDMVGRGFSIRRLYEMDHQ